MIDSLSKEGTGFKVLYAVMVIKWQQSKVGKCNLFLLR